MKTAISIPDDAYRRIEEGASRAGMNRSEFFVTAALRYVDLLDEQSLVMRIDDVLGRSESPIRAEDAEFTAAGRRALRSFTSDDEDW